MHPVGSFLCERFLQLGDNLGSGFRGDIQEGQRRMINQVEGLTWFSVARAKYLADRVGQIQKRLRVPPSP
jgi:hypothetical protein